MSVSVNNLVEAVASVAAGGTFISRDGFAAIANPAPGTYLLTLNSPVDVDQMLISATSRGGYACGGQYVSPTQIRVLTADSTGFVNAPFDVMVLRNPLATDIVPPADPLAVWGAGGGGPQFTPNVYLVTPTLPTPAGMYPNISTAIAAAQADGFGSPIAEYPRAVVLVFPGSYADRVDLIAGIDVVAWDQSRSFQTRVVRPAGPDLGVPLVRFTPLAGSTILGHVNWRGIDMISSMAGESCLVVDGSDIGKLYLENCSLEKGVGAVTCFDALNSAGGFELRARNVTFYNEAGTVYRHGPGGLIDAELVDCLIRRGDSLDNAAISIATGTAFESNLRLNRCEVDGYADNADGLLTAVLTQFRTLTVPVIIAGGAGGLPTWGTVISSCLLNSGVAGQPLVSGVGAFVASANICAPTGAPTGPYSIGLNGGTGPGESIPISMTHAPFFALFAPPEPQTIDECLLRMAAAIVAGAPGGPIP